MSVPQQVKEQADQAKAMLEQRAEAEKARLRGDENPLPDGTQDSPTPAPEVDQWEERFKGLRASRDERAAALEAQLNTQAQQHAEEMAALQQQMAELQQATVPKEIDISSMLSESEIDMLGSDALAVVAKLARQIASGESLQGVKQQLDAMRDQVAQLHQARTQDIQSRQQEAQVNRLEQVKTALRRVVPGLDRIDSDPKYHEWLNGLDPSSGRTRREIASIALQANDLDRVAQFYQQWAQESADPRASMTSPQPSASPQTSLNQGQEGRIWSSEEVKEAYKQLQLGKVPMEEREALRRELFKANAEGRIRR